MNEIIVVISLLFCTLMALTWNYVNTEQTAIRKYSFIHKKFSSGPGTTLILSTHQSSRYDW